MKRTIFIVILAVFVLVLAVVSRQVSGVVFRSYQHPEIVELPALPDVELELSEVLEILSDYDVLHESRVMSFLNYYGLTDLNTKTIFINEDVSQDYRIATLLHELLHVVYARRGYVTTGPYDAVIEAKAQKLYRQMFSHEVHNGTQK